MGARTTRSMLSRHDHCHNAYLISGGSAWRPGLCLWAWVCMRRLVWNIDFDAVLQQSLNLRERAACGEQSALGQDARIDEGEAQREPEVGAHASRLHAGNLPNSRRRIVEGASLAPSRTCLWSLPIHEAHPPRRASFAAHPRRCVPVCQARDQRNVHRNNTATTAGGRLLHNITPVVAQHAASTHALRRHDPLLGSGGVRSVLRQLRRWTLVRSCHA